MKKVVATKANQTGPELLAKNTRRQASGASRPDTGGFARLTKLGSQIQGLHNMSSHIQGSPVVQAQLTAGAWMNQAAPAQRQSATQGSAGVVQLRSIVAAMEAGDRMAMAGEVHNEIDPNAEREFWHQRGVVVAYEATPITLRLDDRDVRVTFDDLFLRILNRAHEVDEWIRVIEGAPEAGPLALAEDIVGSQIIGSFRHQIPMGIQNMEGQNQEMAHNQMPPRYDQEQIARARALSQKINDIYVGSTVVTNPEKSLYRRIDLVRAEITRLRDLLAQADQLKPIQNLSAAENRSLHMLVMFEDNAAKATRPTVYKVGDRHIADMSEYRQNTPFEIKTRAEYKQETGLQ